MTTTKEKMSSVFWVAPLAMILAAIGWVGLQLHYWPFMVCGIAAFVPAFYYIGKALMVK